MKNVRLAILSVVVLAPMAFADQITLKNGDRISGTIVTSDAKTLVLKTEYADKVTIKWDFVQQIESSQPLYVGTKGGQVIVGPVTTSDDSSGRRLAASNASGVTLPRKTTACNTPVPSRTRRNCSLPLPVFSCSQP